MRRRLVALPVAALLAAPGPAHAAWTRTWVVEWYEPAHHYGAVSGVTEPGTDCPAGTNPEPDWVQVMIDAGYRPEVAKWLRDPANPTRSPVHGQNQMAFRGKDRANVYIHPTSAPDGHLVGVTGKIAEGFDLDGNPRTGFARLDGQPGIDNNFARDYTYRIRPDAKLEAIFRARSAGGVIESTGPEAEVWLRDPSYSRELQLLQARIRLTMRPDGTLQGLIGGYRPWQPVYDGWVNARGPVIEALTWVKLPDVFYALRREADYSPPGAKGERTHISFAMRVDATPAFVVTPDGAAEVAGVVSYKDQADPQTGPDPMGNFRFRIVDGIVVQPGQAAVSLPPEALEPPRRGGG